MISVIDLERLPFPKDGPQMYDVMTPIDLNEYGKEITLMSYRKCIPRDGSSIYYEYVGEGGISIPTNLMPNYTKLYSKRNQKLADIKRLLEYDRIQLEQKINNCKYLFSELGITSHFTNNIIDAFKTLDHTIAALINTHLNQ